MIGNKWAKNLTITWGIGIFLIFVPIFRFSNEDANIIFSILVSLLPFFILIFSCFIEDTTYKIVSLISFSLITVISFIFIIGSFLFILPTNGSYYKKLRSIDKNISIYKSDAGATTASGIDIRKETEILPGLLYVDYIFSDYPRYDVDCSVVSDTLYIKDYRTKELLKKIKL